MAKFTSKRTDDRDAMAPRMSSSGRGSPSDTPRAKAVEQPVGGARLSRSCGVHDDAGPLPPMRR